MVDSTLPRLEPGPNDHDHEHEMLYIESNATQPQPENRPQYAETAVYNMPQPQLQEHHSPVSSPGSLPPIDQNAMMWNISPQPSRRQSQATVHSSSYVTEFEHEQPSPFETLPESNGVPGCYILVPSTGEPTEISWSAQGSSAFKPEMSESAKQLICNMKKVRRPVADSERAEIRRNRKHGVCVRCKLFKERVCHPDTIAIGRYM